MIRPLRPTDIVALSGLNAQAALVEVTSQTWPRVQPESGHLSHLALLSHSLTRPVDRRQAWVCTSRSGVRGIAIAKSRAGGLAWDVEHLYAEEDRDAAALLDHLCGQAAHAAVRRVFMETPSGPRGIDIGRRAGFDRYTSAQLFYLPAQAPRQQLETFGARPRLRADEQPLFQLYNAAVPLKVRRAEALTYEEWAALYGGRHKWAPTLFGERQQLVWEFGTWLIGWMEVVFGSRSQFLEVLIGPDGERHIDEMIAYAVSQTSPKAPLYATAREYQPALASGLQRAGFREVSDVDIHVRQLAARVPNPTLVPAQMAGV